jgi:large subunit ribosomal protein L4
VVPVEDLSVPAPKTRELSAKLAALGVRGVLIVTEGMDKNLALAARNLPHVDVRPVQAVDPVGLIAFDRLLITVGAIRRLEEQLQ